MHLSTEAIDKQSVHKAILTPSFFFILQPFQALLQSIFGNILRELWSPQSHEANIFIGKKQIVFCDILPITRRQSLRETEGLEMEKVEGLH